MSNTQCTTSPGVGSHLIWRVSIAGRVSEPMTVSASGYLAPRITAASHTLLPTTGKPSTGVGEVITVNGTNFGPSNGEFAAQVIASGSYGTIRGVSCAVTIPHTQVQSLLASIFSVLSYPLLSISYPLFDPSLLFHTHTHTDPVCQNGAGSRYRVQVVGFGRKSDQ